jgi:4-hydroxy-3-methylbut-2-enyl diphosphate reductase IspH
LGWKSFSDLVQNAPDPDKQWPNDIDATAISAGTLTPETAEQELLNCIAQSDARQIAEQYSRN